MLGRNKKKDSEKKPSDGLAESERQSICESKAVYANKFVVSHNDNRDIFRLSLLDQTGPESSSVRGTFALSSKGLIDLWDLLDRHLRNTGQHPDQLGFGGGSGGVSEPKVSKF